MMIIRLTLILLLFTQINYAQTSNLEKTISKIDIKEDTIKSVFDWITDNILYDVNKLKAYKKGSHASKNSTYKTEKEFKDHLLEEVIKQKKGVCQDYSLLFHSIVQELGYDSYVIEGFTKNKKGKINRSLGHTWNAIKVRGKWKLYDPTWGAGYVNDNNKFIKSKEESWYDVDPKEMIKTHMPFDPIWQLSKSPINYKEFERSAAFSQGGDFDFENLIQLYLNKPRNEQMQGQLERSNKMGNGINLVSKWRKNKTKNLSMDGVLSKQDLLSNAADQSNHAVDLYNEYIKAKNKQFKGKKYTKEIAHKKLLTAKDKIESSIGIYKGVDVQDKKAAKSIKKTLKDFDKLLIQINKELQFVENLKN